MNSELYERILSNINFSIIIWYKNDSNITCFYTNGHNKNVKLNMKFEDYIENNKQLETIYDTLFKTNKDQIKNTDKLKIKLFFLDNSYYYEIKVLNSSNSLFEMALLKNISSRLRLPLTNILGLINLLEKTKLNYEQKKKIKKISISTLKIVELANDVIDIYNLKKNNVKLLSEKFSLQNSIIDSIKLISNYKTNKNININYNINKNLDKYYLGDHARLIQIINNLLSISYDNTKYGSIIIEVDNFDKDQTTPFEFIKPKNFEANLLFKIRDTNTDFNKQTFDLIKVILGQSFQKNIKTDKFQFGLIISKYLCNLMKGNIWITKNDNFGTVFYFNIIINKN